MEELAARLVQALVPMGAEIIALGLEQIGRQTGAAIAVVIGQGGREGGRGNAQPNGRGSRPMGLSSLSIGIALLALVLGTLLIWQIDRSLQKIMEDVNQTVQHHSGDKEGQLAESFREIIQTMFAHPEQFPEAYRKLMERCHESTRRQNHVIEEMRKMTEVARRVADGDVAQTTTLGCDVQPLRGKEGANSPLFWNRFFRLQDKKTIGFILEIIMK